jgi:hypothetical protein
MWKTSWGLSHWETHGNTTTSKQHMMISRKFFLFKSATLSIYAGKKIDYLHLKDFLKYKCELYLKQPWTPPQCKIITAYCTSNLRLPLKLDDEQLILSLEILD